MLLQYVEKINVLKEKIEIVYRFQDELVTAARLAEQIENKTGGGCIMARTRNRQMKQAEAFVQASPKKLSGKWYLYQNICRYQWQRRENQVETQKTDVYAESHPDIEVVKFYKDDGISGTKFDRDDFVRMLGDIKTKEINTVIVKDLSRFGRDLKKYQNI